MQEDASMTSSSLKNEQSYVGLTKLLQEFLSHYFNLSFQIKWNNGCYESNDDDEDEMSRSTTEEEVKLLMNLSLTPVPSSCSLNGGKTTKMNSIKKMKRNTVNANDDLFVSDQEDKYSHALCPSLSLFPHDNPSSNKKKMNKLTPQSMLKIPFVCSKRHDVLSSITNTLLNNIGEAFAFSLRTRLLSRMDSLKRPIKLSTKNNIGRVNVTDESIYDSANSVGNNNDIESKKILY